MVNCRVWTSVMVAGLLAWVGTASAGSPGGKSVQKQSSKAPPQTAAPPPVHVASAPPEAPAQVCDPGNGVELAQVAEKVAQNLVASTSKIAGLVQGSGVRSLAPDLVSKLKQQSNKASASGHATEFAIKALQNTASNGRAPKLDTAAIGHASNQALQAISDLQDLATSVAELIPLLATDAANDLERTTDGAIDQATQVADAVDMLAALDTGYRTVGIAGISSNEDRWTLVGDVQTTSVDLTKPSFSLGLEYAAYRSLSRVVIRKANVDSLTGDSTMPTVGNAILSPSQANFSFLAHGEWWPYPARCDPNCSSNNLVVLSTWRAYGAFELSRVQVSETGAPTSAGSMSPMAMSVGLVYRLEGHMPKAVSLGDSNRLGMNVYGGFTARMISGLHDKDHDKQHAENDMNQLVGLDGSTARQFWGIEGGVSIQVGNVLIDPHVTYLPYFLASPEGTVKGLTGLQLQINLTFALPWIFSGGKTST